MTENEIPEEILHQYKYAVEQARNDPDRYVAWIKE